MSNSAVLSSVDMSAREHGIARCRESTFIGKPQQRLDDARIDALPREVHDETRAGNHHRGSIRLVQERRDRRASYGIGETREISPRREQGWIALE